MESLQDMVARYGELAWRRRWWGLAAAWIVCVAGWIGVALMPAQYEANARVYIDADAVLTPLLRGLAADSSMSDQIDLLQHMLLSRPNIEKIIAKTDLALDVKTATDAENMVARLGQTIRVAAQTRNIFSITYRNHDRQLAFDVVQAVLASYIENRAGDNREDMEKASHFLDEQIASYEKQLKDAEAKRAEFRTRYIDLLPRDSGLNRLDEARAQVVALTGDLADAKGRRVRLAREVAATPALVTTEQGGPGDAHTDLKAAEEKLRQLRQVYTDAYPEVVTQRHAVDELRKSPHAGAGPSGGSKSVANPLYEQLKLQLVETDSAIESLVRRVDDATRERDRLTDIARGAPNLEAQYLNLNRDYDVLRKNYDELLARREGMRIATAAQVRADNVKMVIIDPPQVPQTPVAPARVVLSVAVLLAGLAAGGGVVAGIIMLDQSVHTIIELRALGRPVIGAISLAALPPPLAVRLRHAATFCSAAGLLVVALGGVLLHYTQHL